MNNCDFIKNHIPKRRKPFKSKIKTPTKRTVPNEIPSGLTKIFNMNPIIDVSNDDVSSNSNVCSIYEFLGNSRSEGEDAKY